LAQAEGFSALRIGGDSGSRGNEGKRLRSGDRKNRHHPKWKPKGFRYGDRLGMRFRSGERENRHNLDENLKTNR